MSETEIHVLVRNISSDTDEARIRAQFSKFGPVLAVHLDDGHSPRPRRALVKFKHPTAPEFSLLPDRIQLDGKECNVDDPVEVTAPLGGTLSIGSVTRRHLSKFPKGDGVSAPDKRHLSVEDVPADIESVYELVEGLPDGSWTPEVNAQKVPPETLLEIKSSVINLAKHFKITRWKCNILRFETACVLGSTGADVIIILDARGKASLGGKSLEKGKAVIVERDVVLTPGFTCLWITDLKATDSKGKGASSGDKLSQERYGESEDDRSNVA